MAIDVDRAVIIAIKTQLDVLRDDAFRRSTTGRAYQFLLFVREVKIKCNELISDVDLPVGITAKRVVEQQNALSQVKDSLQNWPFGSLTSLEVRQKLVDLVPASFPDEGSVQADTQAANIAFNNLSAEIEALLVVARAAGQLYNADPVTGLETQMLLSAPETDALRARAVTVRDSISGAP